mgnify:FL=1
MKVVDFLVSRTAVRLARAVWMFIAGIGLFFLVRGIGVKGFLIWLGLSLLATALLVLLFIATDPFERKDP